MSTLMHQLVTILSYEDCECLLFAHSLQSSLWYVLATFSCLVQQWESRRDHPLLLGSVASPEVDYQMMSTVKRNVHSKDKIIWQWQKSSKINILYTYQGKITQCMHTYFTQHIMVFVVLVQWHNFQGFAIFCSHKSRINKLTLTARPRVEGCSRCNICLLVFEHIVLFLGLKDQQYPLLLPPLMSRNLTKLSIYDQYGIHQTIY